ncbi:MAG: DoxX family membrane protein [Candidatus Aminicenantes bacterium]|nr:DoxX family membrane protein [Candidatus Aminicenantes bacterium]
MKTKIVKFLSSTPVQVLCRLVLGGLFIYASLDKIAHPQAFAKIIYNYQLFPDFSVYLSAILVPWVEMVTGIFLVLGIFSRAAAFTLSSLLVVFIIAISINLIRGVDFNCGCFVTVSGEKSDPVGLLIRDFLILIPGLIVLLFHKSKKERLSKSRETA